MISFFNWFVKITAWPVQKILFRTKIYYEDKKAQSRKIKGPAIIISNHTSVYDYAVFLFVFFGRTIRYQMAELLFEKKGLGRFLKMLGGIRVDRLSYSDSSFSECEAILARKGVIGIFPEGRLPKEGEIPPLPFLPGAAKLALTTGAPVIPIYTNGCYFKKKRARVIIGKPIDLFSLYEENLSEKENLSRLSETMREKIIALGRKMNG